MNSHPKIAVIGGGSWATAIAKMLCVNLDEIAWYMRNESAIDHIKTQKHNPNYLSSVEFDVSKLKLSNDINKMAIYADYLIFVIPSAFLYAELKKLNTSLKGKIVFSAIKGIVPESGLIVGEHFHEKYNIPFENIGVITGPCHAEEVAMERLSYLTIACQDEDKATQLGAMLKSRYIRTKISDDIIGTEYAAMLKNIFAIAAGISHGLGYGDNFQSVLMSNSIREMNRFIRKVHQMKRNINNSAYLGDLLVTGYSTFSRNRMFGNMIGKGYSVESTKLTMQMVAEGFPAAKSIHDLGLGFSVDTPIATGIYNILWEKQDPAEVFASLEKAFI